MISAIRKQMKKGMGGISIRRANNTWEIVPSLGIVESHDDGFTIFKHHNGYKVYTMTDGHLCDETDFKLSESREVIKHVMAFMADFDD